MPTVKVLLAREAIIGAPERTVVRGKAECGSPSSSASDGSGNGKDWRRAEVWEQRGPNGEGS